MKRLIRVSFIISFILILSACSKQKEEIMDSNYIREEIVMDDGFEIEAIDFDEGKGYAIGNTGKTGKGIVILNNDGTVDGRIDFDNRVSGDILDFCKIKEGYQILIMNHNSIDILKINNQGKQKENFSLCTEKGESVSWFDVQQFDEKEGLYTASNGELYYFAEDGTLKNRIKIEEGILCSLLVKEESVFLTYFTVSGEKLKIYEYKKSAIKNSKNGERIVPVSYETGISPYSNPYLIDSRNGQYDFYLNDGRNVYGYSLGTEAAEKVFNWLSCDFNGTEIKQILSKTETVFFIISTKIKQQKFLN